jgi:hypothetical protein
MDNILTLLTMAQRVYGRWLTQQLLASVFVVLGMMMVTAILLSAALIGCIFMAYMGLLYSGVEPATALLCTAALIVGMIGICVLMVVLCLRRLRRMPSLVTQKLPVASSVHAFIRGFMQQ